MNATLYTADLYIFTISTKIAYGNLKRRKNGITFPQINRFVVNIFRCCYFCPCDQIGCKQETKNIL